MLKSMAAHKIYISQFPLSQRMKCMMCMYYSEGPVIKNKV